MKVPVFESFWTRWLYVSVTKMLPLGSIATPRGPLNPPAGGGSAGSGTARRNWPLDENFCARKFGMSPTQTLPCPSTVISRPPSENWPSPDPVDPKQAGEAGVPFRLNLWILFPAASTTYTRSFDWSTARPRMSPTNWLEPQFEPLEPNLKRNVPLTLNTSTRWLFVFTT